MTRKRFKKLCMGRGHMNRNKAEAVCKKLGYNSNMPYVLIYRSIFSPCYGIESKKQAKYFGEPYIDRFDLKFIESCIESHQHFRPTPQERNSIKQTKKYYEQFFLKLGMWNYGLVAEIIVNILTGKQDIETVRKSVRIMPWEMP